MPPVTSHVNTYTHLSHTKKTTKNSRCVQRPFHKVMASIVADILRLTFKLLLSKVRDKGAEKLKHGDVSDERFRDFIVRELTAIREKLEGLCKIDLIASANFFKDGVSLMYHSFGKCRPQIKSEVYKSDFDDTSLVDTDVTNIELDDWAVLHLMSDGLLFDKVDSENTFFTEAKDFLKKAADSATKAFSNEGLDVYDRVLSMKFRVAATMLQFIDEPEVAVVLCKNYIEQLNDLPEVREAFSVRFGGFNMRRLFCEMRREALIGAVVSINRILWEYLHLCSKGDEFLRNWPEIAVNSSRKIHPVLSWELCRGFFWSFGEFGKHLEQLNAPVDIATNSKGDFIVADRYNSQIKAFSKDGNLSQRVCEPTFLQTFEEDILVTNLLHPQCLDIDKGDQLYIGSSYESPQNFQLTNEIIAVDKDGTFRWSFGRGIASFHRGTLTSLAVDKNRNRVFTLCGSTVFVLNTDGIFLSCFTLTGDFKPAHESHLCVTSQGDLIITAMKMVYFISKRAANDTRFKSRTIVPSRFIKPDTKRIPYNFNPSGIAFNSHTEEVIVVDRASNSLIMFDTMGNLKRKIYFYERYASGGATVTRDGHVAVASKSTNQILIL
ncbi:uncharacterized protein [Montipora capricornis]|uniref:uncharacterized protein n=1 Tax=Montipora capricornis TaxID=246305 RepID=UPI0035F19B30